MKKIVLSIITLITVSCAAYCQMYSEGAYLMQMQHKFDARSEAMGRGNAALTGETFYLLDNPASTSFMDGGGISYTYFEPHILLNSGSFVNVGGISFNAGRYGSIGFIYQDYLEGKYKGVDIDGNQLEENEIRFTNFTANYSFKFNNDLAFGINGNFYKEVVGDFEQSSFLLDIGALKKFNFANEEIPQNIYAAISVKNILNHTYKNEDRTIHFPILLRAAGIYEVFYNPAQEKLTPMHVTICAEYEDNLIDKYFTKVKFGGEVGIYEIVKLRAGYFDEFRKHYDDLFITIGNISHLTYGFGLSLPLYKLTNIPWELNIDYAKAENSYYLFGIPDDYKLLTINLSIKI